MFATKKVISKEEQKKIEDKQKLENQERFILWLKKMNSIHQANVPRMLVALDSII
jgi:hypothetical protein